MILTIKVFGAKAIRTKLQPNHIQWISRIAGLALVISGIVLLYQSGNNSII